MGLKKQIITTFSILWVSTSLIFSSDANNRKDTVPVLFQSNEMLHLTFALNLDSLYKGGFSEQTRYMGKLTCTDIEEELYTMPVYFTKRGHFRKSFNVCDFPPLRLHLYDKYSIETPFEGLGKIKMVTHCQNNDSDFEQYVIQEYLLYKVYNILTDYSFKVRLARIIYSDLGGKYPDMQKYAFFIENPADLAQRLHGLILDIHHLHNEVVDQYQFLLMSLFQYMIINQDWSVGLLHNVELVGIYPSLKPITVPFDFDIAWLIDIPYKNPTLSYRQGKEPERIFLPKNADRKILKLAIHQFKLKRDAIINLYKNDTLLSIKNKERVLASLESFFKLIEDKHRVEEEFIRSDGWVRRIFRQN